MKRYSLFLVMAVLIGSSAYAAESSIPVEDRSTQADPGDIPIGAEGYNPQEALDQLKMLEGFGKAWPEVKADADIANIRKELQTYAEAQQACKLKEERANTFCIEARNPDLQKYVMVAQTLMAGVSGMADACSKFGKLMSLGNAALGLYQAQCGSWKGMCSSSCSKAVAAVKAAQANIKTYSTNFATQAKAQAAKYRAVQPPGSMEEAAQWYDKGAVDQPKNAQRYSSTYLDRELVAKGDYKAVAKKLETCNGYAVQLATSALGVIGIVKSMGEANNCKDDSTNASLAAATPVDCTIAANKANNMTCICQDAPRTAGCEGGMDNALSAKSADSMRTASTSDYVPNSAGGKVNVGGAGGGMDLAAKGTDGGGGSSLPGGPMGGSGGIGGSGSGFGGGADKGEAAQKGGLNTNILGGEGGGGGGGSYGGSYGDESLRQYLPGGAKDPSVANGLSGQAAAAKEVTAPGGKSNWEKVRDRYRDNKSSLIGY